MRVGQMQDRVPAQFDDGAELISEVGAAMCTALDQGNAVVLIAIGTHRQLLETELSVRGIDIVEALGTGQYVSLDALETRSAIIIDGSLDVIRFAEVIGAPIDRAAEQHGCVLIFGDLVPLMYADGQHTGVVELESLWRAFLASRPVFLDCQCLR